ncbi:hypothetical protein [Halarcobacter anaerophilus]|uniref:Uncharacterized protein n=1 Tax=Halarcobacter anaerophilus TaxID=877500 RepID=A0A4Q0XX58_9BACT|nr:hypothetical protein [Halarcobacter anaerophilus]QDF27967.1 hypothetical protein AANAER_0465 [Halarcobacter anaerophilus]RXJ61803.1 hypothetical protein CRV06_12475 [Halarcobacter anaerophilus]
MKHIKGFKKNYFSLAAITIYSAAKKLCDNEARSKKIKQFNQNYLNEEDDEAPPLEEFLLSSCTFEVCSKPCHCDCFFKLKTKLAISNFKFIPRCPYYTTYFAFRRTGVHPPFITLF